MVKRNLITVSHYFELTWWVLLAVSLYSAYEAELLSGVMALLAFAMAAWPLMPLSERLSLLRPKSLLFVLVLLLGTAEGIRRWTMEKDVLLAVGYGLASLIPLCFLKRHHRLWSWLAFIGCAFLSLTAVIAEGQFTEYVCFIWLLVFGAANLNAAHLYFLAGQSEATLQNLNAKYFFQFSASVLSGLLFGAVVFFSFPRETFWMSSWGLRQRQKNVGYTESVALDGTSLTEESNALSFTVESEQSDFLFLFAKDLYFRGRAVDHFDGHRWVASPRHLSAYQFNKESRIARSHAPGIQKLKIYREPSATAALFYPGVLRSLQISPAVSGGVRTDNRGGFFRTRTEAFPFKYEVEVSNPLLPTQAASWTPVQWKKHIESSVRGNTPFEPGHDELEQALAIPQEIRQATYFKNWLNELPAGEMKKLPLISILSTLKSHFRRHFRATYKHDDSPEKAFQSFLSSTHRGHCEYFATAAALFLRSLGIPARLVVGYHGGEFNRFSRVLEVKESFAHAWVEYFIPGYGWFPFDPTPPIVVATGPRFFSSLVSYFSAARFWFHRYVVNYNGRTQMELFHAVSFKHTNEPISQPRSDRLRHFLFWFVGVVFVWTMSRLYRRHQRKVSSLPRYYQVFIGRLKKQGWERLKGESFRSFHDRLREVAFSNSRLVEELDRALEQELYSSRAILPGQKSFLEAYVKKSNLARPPVSK